MEYPYEIIYKNIRNAYAKINHKGIVIFTIPQKLQGNEKFISDFLKKWEDLYIKYSKRCKIQTHSDSEVMLFWEKVERINVFSNWKNYSITTKNKKLKEILLEYSIERLEKFSNQLWIPYRTITVRKMRSRWWSCNSTQDIVLNLELIHLPQKYIQYVVAHECAHLKEKNHSKEFRIIVESLYPNYKSVRKEMKNFVLM